MIQINIQNVEKIIFQNDQLWRDLPDLRHLREQWRLSRVSPALRAMGKKAILDFLNKVKKEHENIISKHLGTSVTIDKLDYHIVQNMEFSIEDAELELNLLEAEKPLYSYFGTYRKNNKIYITFWR
jgi:hypothetical protein